ncbi:ArsR/SmtB family transcription factor [Frondihabitans australicus]|uniref:DNA-binding transcriptional ArsR family regulator n=1 Tax=Frondihabitans australicus TaxID=386892 RepID=A0A495IC65_9MICO|nr:helix-turn-helix domain-containing protein [Frondihabitans australicus]RKR73512.1 DNA-binding transcriptional ArsR family regulator [Frondihabitans australicus]
MSDYPVPDMADVTMVEILRAVADPIRLHIVGVLADGEPKAKTLDGWGVDITKSTMSHHFKILREAGVTRTLVDGRNHAIQLRRQELDERFPGLIPALIASMPAPPAA